MHNWNYHGSVDETFATLDEDGRVVEREGNIGQAGRRWTLTTRVVEINDLEGLEAALADGDVACCLFEPALTNIGIVLPEPGYHEAVRELCTRYGTLLVIDETHTICAGPGGCTKAWGLDPDIVTIGKTLGAGMPSAAYGMTRGAQPARRTSTPTGRTPTSAGSAAHSPATRCRSRRCARRSVRS